jgi:[ribosomal protein S18]-alanine N-acetyltransferase
MSEPEVRYAPFREEHLGPVLEIESEAYPEPWSPGMFEDELTGDLSHFFVMLIGGAVAGYGGYWLVLDEAHITSVTVARPHRGRGLGRALLRHILDDAAALGVRTASLEVRASNLVACGLYESEGFTAVGIRKKYYYRTGEDAVVMRFVFPEIPAVGDCG